MNRSAISLLLTAAVSASSAVLAAPSTTFMTGESMYGRPALESTVPARTVDLRSAPYANVAYGETIRFHDGQRQFTWTFNGVDLVSLPLKSIAPSDLNVPERFRVYVARDPLNRN